MAITSVEVHAICRRSSPHDSSWAAHCRIAPYTQWTKWYYGTEENLTDSYAEYSYTWATNPDTSGVWTLNDIIVNAVFGVWLWQTVAGTGDARCTQVWLVVNQDESPASFILRPCLGPSPGRTDPEKVLTNDGDSSYVWYTTSGETPRFPNAGGSFAWRVGHGALSLGFIWIEATQLHYIDQYTTQIGLERAITGTDTTVNGTAGHLWVEGVNLHYIDQNGDERWSAGTLEGATGKTSGQFWIELTKLRYIDASGNERYIEGTIV